MMSLLALLLLISRNDGAGNKAEYVLVGSFVSWFLALLFVPLIK